MSFIVTREQLNKELSWIFNPPPQLKKKFIEMEKLYKAAAADEEQRYKDEINKTNREML